MAISVTERVSGLTATKRIGFERVYTREFLVIGTAGEKFGPIAARNASGIPLLGQSFNHAFDSIPDASAICRSIDCRPLEGSGDAVGNAWLVTCHYESSTGRSNTDPSELIASPTARPTKWSWSTTHFTQRLEKCERIDAQGNSRTNQPVASSAGDPLEPGLEVDTGRAILNYERNENLSDWLTPTRILDWVFRVNSDTFLGKAAGTWIIRDIVATKEYESAIEGSPGAEYVRVVYTFEYDPNGFDVSKLDEGRNELDTQGKPKPIVDAAGNPLGVRPLDGTGKALPESQIAIGAYIHFKWRPYERKAFASIPGGAIVLQ